MNTGAGKLLLAEIGGKEVSCPLRFDKHNGSISSYKGKYKQKDKTNMAKDDAK